MPCVNRLHCQRTSHPDTQCVGLRHQRCSPLACEIAIFDSKGSEPNNFNTAIDPMRAIARILTRGCLEPTCVVESEARAEALDLSGSDELRCK